VLLDHIKPASPAPEFIAFIQTKRALNGPFTASLPRSYSAVWQLTYKIVATQQLAAGDRRQKPSHCPHPDEEKRIKNAPEKY
jgi:hypothetical protein